METLRRDATKKAFNKGLNIVGSDGDDIIVGTSYNDVLYGGAGNDQIWAGAGTSYLGGGEGDDLFVFDSSLKGEYIIIDFEAGDKIGFTPGLTSNNLIFGRDVNGNGILYDKTDRDAWEIQVMQPDANDFKWGSVLKFDVDYMDFA